MLKEILQQFIQNYIALVTEFFSWYNAAGRRILDFLHNMFNGAFNALLLVAVLMSVLYLIMSFYILFKKREQKQEEPVDDENLPLVTVQIPTFNELVAIRCAKSCLGFDYPKDRYEILIGDDSNRPEISRKLKEFAKQHSLVKVIKRQSNIGYKPGNLNNMLKYSKGEIIVIFDSDFAPQPDFLKRIVKPFMKDKKIAGVQARWKLINYNQNLVSVLGSTIVSTCHHITIPFMYQRRGITFLCGSAEAVRKSVLAEIGCWESGNLTEDIEFSLRLLERGYKIEYLDDLECDSEVPYTLKDLYKQQMRWAYGVISSFKKHFTTLFLKNENIGFKEKFYISFFCSGYLLSFLLLMLFTTGTISFITHPPGPIDLSRFFGELFRNVALTSGIIISSIFTMAKTKNIKKLASMFAASFSIGLIVTYYVNMGIFKVLFNKPMEWYMLNKKGNLEET